MSESGDYSPGPAWSGHDFKDARSYYDKHAGRSYDDARSSGKTLKDLLPESLETNSPFPLVIVSDQTGSMGKWPAVMFSKLPYLDHEVRTEYLGEDAEICFGAIGDAHCSGEDEEDYPLQMRPFSKGAKHKKSFDELVIEGGGGGQTTETYELAALYLARNVHMPNALNPIVIFIGDEMPYDSVSKNMAKSIARVTLESAMSTKDIFAELKEKFSVYFIQKPYDAESIERLGSTSKKIYAKWKTLVGEDHIALLPQADRVVDVIFGILAKESDKIDYFKKEIEGRQRADQVDTVYKSLDTIHRFPKDASSTRKLLAAGRSTMHKPLGGKPGKKLLP